MNKEYLGDAVYIEVNRFGDIILTTEDGVNVTNRIVLEPTVLEAFENYLRRLRRELAQDQSDSATAKT